MGLTIYQLTGGATEAVMGLDDDDHIIFAHETLNSKSRALLRARANTTWERGQPRFEFEGLEYKVCETA